MIANVQEPGAPLSATATPTDETLCPSFHNGAVAVMATGGWGGYSYSSDNVSFGASSSFSSLAPGSYIFWVKDAKGCVSAPKQATVKPAVMPVVSLVTKHPCEGQANGWIYPSVDSWSGPALSYTSSMPSGATASISAGSKFENLAAYSSYSLNLLINGSVCPSAATVVDLKAFAPPVASGFVFDSATCASATNGAVSFSINQGAGGNYRAALIGIDGAFKDSTLTSIFSNGDNKKIGQLATGQYSLQITDTAQCSSNSSLITLPVSSKAVTISSLTPTSPICHGEANGTIAVAGGKGFGDWTVSIKDSGLAAVVNDNIPRSDSLVDKTYGNLTAGDYTVSLSDTSNCSYSAAVTVPQKAPIAFTVTKIRYVTTAQSSDGSLDYLVSGGNGHFNITLQNPPAGAVVAPGKFSNLPAGTYTVQIKDSLNTAYCNAEETFTIKAPQIPLAIAGANPQQPKCYAASNGSVTLNVTGGWGGYKYSKDSISWQSSSTIAGLAAGSHKFWVADSLGAIKDTTLVIGQPEAIAVAPPVISDVSCNGGSNGTVAFTASGGNGAYSLKLDGESSATPLLPRTGLAAGVHTYTVADANGCTYSNSFTINEPQKLRLQATLAGYNGYAIRCFGATDTIHVAATGGTAAYRYILGTSTDTISTSAFANLSNGTYKVKVVDAHGCVDSSTVLLNAPTAVSWKKVTIADPTCNGVANGAISLQPDGGVSGYSYNIYRDANVVGLNLPNSDFNNLPVGDYRITVTDANGCSHDTTGLKLIEPDSLQINSFNTIASICKGDSGKAVVVLKGGTAPYTVKVGSDLYSANPSTQINLLAGNYTAYISDSKGCGIGRGNPNASDIPFTVTEPTSKLTASPNVDPVKCFGESNGSVRLSATGGWGGYSYYLVDVANGNPPFNVTKTNLKAGSYKFVVSDSLNCHDTLSITVPQPQQLAALLNKVDVQCNGGQDGQLTVSDTLGGVQPYHYQLDGGTPTTSNLFTNLLAGEHQLSMVDANGCVLTKTETINQPDEIISTLVDSVNPPCGTSTGMLMVNVAGGTPTLNMSWNIAGTAVNGAQVSNLSAGSYNLTVTDGHGCQKPFTYTLVNPDAPQLENVVATDLRCFGDQSGKVEFYVNGTNQPVDVSLTFGGTTVGSNHFSDKQTSNFSNLQSGSYELSMVDSHGCFSSKAITVAEPSKVTLALSKTDVTCFGSTTGSAIATVNGGVSPYAIHWSTGEDVQAVSADTLTQLVGGSYVATVTDSKGCGDKLQPLQASVTILAPTAPLAFGAQAISKPKCADENTGQALLSAQGGWGSYTFALNGQSSSNGQFYSLASGSYSAILSDANGCSIAKTVVVPQTLPLSLMASTVNNLTCYQNASGSIYVTPVNGETPFLYGLDGGSLGYSNGFGKLAAGTHTIVVQDKNGCSSQLDVLLTQPDSLNLDFMVVSDTCGRGVGLLAPMVYGGTQPFTYTYNDKVFEEALKHLYSGNYKISVKDRYGCRDSSIATVGDVSGPKIANVAVSPVSCAEKSDGAATITTVGGNGSISVVWPGTNLSGATVSGLPKGNTKAVATDQHQCSDTVTVSIPGPDPLTLAAANLVNPLCYGYTNGSATVSPMGGTAPYSILWNNGTAGATLDQLPSGSYTAQVTDAHECQNSTTLSLTDPDPIKPTVPTSAVLCSNQSVTLDAGYSGCDYSWTSTNGFTSNLRTVTISDEGTYTVWVTDIKGCKGNASVNLTKLAQDIDADFVVATTTAVGDTIVLVEFTMPIPDSIGWDFPGDAFTLINRGGNELYIRAEKEGTFPVALTTHMGECSDRFEKTVTVVPALPKSQNSDYYPNIFSEVKLYPNPNDGLFTVEVTLHNEAALEVGLYNNSQQQLFYQKLSPAGFFTISSDRLNLMPGFYLLSLKANGQTKTVKIIVQK
ncbi:MAG TPA: T9SS type A sorting domain-containing protein [Williamwhitmania sp.]|nr:T9SS type A sorting domain-containing protein [Williamwhitmania sp.]